ncbi:4Fe-4S binding protein [Carboxylicivirga sp. A043]|uniref:4Fe-4S binding protein n=1 Tax=Carboxylicivirga litoralis TaxID=2816963 RepID=UPI0021CAEE0F|nr:4Fe-4S binding protein [Carboxylicivirga sp. A043]MCU4156137.1 4Fe-4S binding protein [Carboxylicivirga sp. A043]
MLQRIETVELANKKVHAIYFSPARSTKKIVEAIASGISGEFMVHDITQGLHHPIELTSSDIVVVGVPAFSGRVPELAAQYISQIKGNGARAIVACAYGNCHYENTLSELSNICVKAGFVPISSGAFVSRHSLFPELGKGRPDARDLENAQQFGKKSVMHSRLMNGGVFKLDSSISSRAQGVVPPVVKANADCNFCGRCVQACPVGAIDASNPKKTDREACISCTRCIDVCPYGARQFSGLMYMITKKRFVDKNKERKEIEVNIPL